MKKTLVAIAALSAISAFAQSSVTMYGIVDAGVQGTHFQHAGNVDTGQSGSVATKSDLRTAGVAGSSQSSSRLGVKGIEDIGGGMKADFVAEFGLKVTDPSFSGSSNDVNSSTFDNRQTNVGLTGSFGEVRIGRQYSGTHGVIAATDAAGGNNLVGGTTYVGGNSTSALAQTPFYGNNAYVIRSSNALTYKSPSFNGLVAMVGGAANKKTEDGTDTDASSRGIGASYTNGPLFLAAGYTKHNANAKTATASTTANTNAQSFGLMGMASIPTTAAVPVFINQKETVFGGTYELPKAKLFANYLKTQADGQVNGTAFTNDVKRTAYEIGVKAPVTGAINVFVKAGRGSTNLTNASNIATASANQFNFSAQQAGAEYNFSKRTNLYAIYGHAKADQTATTDARAVAYAVGVRHQF